MNSLTEALEKLTRLQRVLSGHCMDGRYSEAVAVGRELLSITLGFGDPYGGHTSSDTAWALRYLGDAHVGLGQTVSAEDAYREAVAITTTVFGYDNVHDTLPSLLKLGHFLHAEGKVEEAATILTHALSTYELNWGPDALETVQLRSLIQSSGSGMAPQLTTEEKGIAQNTPTNDPRPG